MRNQNHGFIPNFFRQQIIKLFVVAFCLVLLETACFNSDQKSENAAPSENSILQNSITNQNTAQKEINALCQNPFYPTNATQKREYRITSDAPSSYVLTQSPNGSDSFVETRSFSNGEKIETKWEGTSEGLRNTEYTSFIPTPGGAVGIKTASS